MSNGRQMARWQTQVDANGAAKTVDPMSAAAAAAIAVQYTGTVDKLQATLDDIAGLTAVVIPKGIDTPLRTSIAAMLGQQTDADDVLIVDLYAASNTGYGTVDGVLLERLGVATFKADGDALIDGVGANTDLQMYYGKTVTLNSDLRAEARSKVALDVVSGQTPGTVELTDPGECGAIVAVLHKHASLANVASAALVWKVWE